jgi:UPF0755 protein
MKEKKLTIARYVFEIMLIIILSVMYYLNKPIQTSKILHIPEGSINKIISQLQRNHYDVSKIDSFILRFIGSPQSGWINLHTTKNTKADFLYKLTTSKAALQKVTLIPGETTYIFLTDLAKKLNLNAVKLMKEFYAQSPIDEGILVPNTYNLPLGIDEHKVIQLLLYLSMKETKAVSKKIFGTYNQTKWFHYVAIASIIQKESANNKEMPIVSSVIYNRLKRGMKLQMDGTLNYGKYSHIKVTPQRIKNDMSIYNTYKHKGIPVTPVCNVGFNAIKAAIFPAKTKYLYFMKSKSGTHDFSCNYSTHLSNIRRATK